MAHIDISLGGKFKYAYGCCPGHDRFPKPGNKYSSGRSRRARAKYMKMGNRLARHIRKQRLLLLILEEAG